MESGRTVGEGESDPLNTPLAAYAALFRRSLTEAIDTTTPGERLVFHIFGALGQLERDFIRERPRAGLSAVTLGLAEAAPGPRGGAGWQLTVKGRDLIKGLY